MGETVTDEIVLEPEETRMLPAVREHEAMVTRSEVSVADVLAQRDKIKQVMQQVMIEDVHYGKIPGVNKPCLLKPGAEVLNVTFRFAPSYHSERIFHDDGHLTVISKCILTHAPSGMVLGEGEGLCTTRESRYAYRTSGRVCPACGADTIIKGKAEYGGGWVCFKKKGGCGEKFLDGDLGITQQETGKVANPDLPDTWNTVLKMGAKRALVAAILNCTAASDIFTQDVEDMPPSGGHDAENTERETTPAGPKSWPEIFEWAALYGDVLGWNVWVQDASELLYKARESSALTTEQKAELGGKAAAAIVALRAAVDPAQMPPVSREDVQKAWAAVLDGISLPGPEWRMGPTEEDRPAFGEDVPAGNAGVTPEEQAEADEIPFGEAS